MWEIERHDDFYKRIKTFQKKYRRELQNALDNLDTFHLALQAGAKPSQIKKGFIHAEPHGVLAIDQKGHGKHLKETRLYIYADQREQVIHVITIGDKDSQEDDIKFCSEFAKSLLSGAQEPREDDTENGQANDQANDQATDQPPVQERIEDAERRVG